MTALKIRQRKYVIVLCVLEEIRKEQQFQTLMKSFSDHLYCAIRKVSNDFRTNSKWVLSEDCVACVIITILANSHAIFECTHTHLIIVVLCLCMICPAHSSIKNFFCLLKFKTRNFPCLTFCKGKNMLFGKFEYISGANNCLIIY